MRDTVNHNILCETMKIYSAGFFIAAWKILFHETICRIESITQENDNVA